MKKLISLILLVAIVSTVSGCAAVCSPQAQASAIQTGGGTGLVLGGAQFSACLGYNIVKNAMADKSPTSVTDSIAANAVEPADDHAATPAVDATPVAN